MIHALPATSNDTLALIPAALHEVENDGETCVGIAAVRFLLLTGCRRMEVLALPRAWLDEDAACLRFGDTKSGAQLRAIGRAAFAAVALPGQLALVLPGRARQRPLRRPVRGVGAPLCLCGAGRRHHPRPAAHLRRGGRRDGLLGTVDCGPARAQRAGREGALCPCARRDALGCSGFGGWADRNGPFGYRDSTTVPGVVSPSTPAGIADGHASLGRTLSREGARCFRSASATP